MTESRALVSGRIYTNLFPKKIVKKEKLSAVVNKLDF